MRFTIMALAALMLAGPAIAQTADSAHSAPKPKKEKKNLSRRETRTGSNMVRMSCHTQAEWATLDGSDTGGVSNSANARSTNDPGTLGGNAR